MRNVWMGAAVIALTMAAGTAQAENQDTAANQEIAKQTLGACMDNAKTSGMPADEANAALQVCAYQLRVCAMQTQTVEQFTACNQEIIQGQKDGSWKKILSAVQQKMQQFQQQQQQKQGGSPH